MVKNSISVIIPAYNESKHIKDTLYSIHAYLKNNFAGFEIILVDDGSTDGTYDCALRAAKELPNLKLLRNEVNSGKGASVKKGMLSAAYEYAAFTDADLSTPIEGLNKAVDCLENGSDLVIGSRTLRESNIIKKQSFLRRSMGKTFNALIQIFLFKGIKDTQCGFKCFKNDAAKKLFSSQRLKRFCFDVEIIYIAKKRGYSIKELPIEWTNRYNSRVSIVKDSLNMFLCIFKIKLNNLRKIYEV